MPEPKPTVTLDDMPAVYACVWRPNPAEHNGAPYEWEYLLWAEPELETEG